MAVIKFAKINKITKSVKTLEKYLEKEGKTKEELKTGIDCTIGRVEEDFNAVKKLHNKTDGRQYGHMIQSFAPGEVTPEKAHEVGKELQKKIFKGHQCLIVTHADKDHIHNHFLFNSVNMDTGKKWQQNRNDLYKIRELNDEICKEHELSIPEPNKNRYLSMAEIKVAEKGESWKFRLMNEIDSAKELSGSKEEFIENMNIKGYEVNWTDKHKYITYTTPEGNKCRDRKLPSEYSKEVMENEFSREVEGSKQAEQRGAGIGEDKQRKQNGISDVVGNDIIGEIQREVSDAEERILRAIGDDEQESGGNEQQSRGVEECERDTKTGNEQGNQGDDWGLGE